MEIIKSIRHKKSIRIETPVGEVLRVSRYVGGPIGDAREIGVSDGDVSPGSGFIADRFDRPPGNARTPINPSPFEIRFIFVGEVGCYRLHSDEPVVESLQVQDGWVNICIAIDY